MKHNPCWSTSLKKHCGCCIPKLILSGSLPKMAASFPVNCHKELGHPSLLLNAPEKLRFFNLKIFVRKDLVHLVSLVRDRKLAQLNKSYMPHLKHKNDKN